MRTPPLVVIAVVGTSFLTVWRESAASSSPLEGWARRTGRTAWLMMVSSPMVGGGASPGLSLRRRVLRCRRRAGDDLITKIVNARPPFGAVALRKFAFHSATV